MYCSPKYSKKDSVTCYNKNTLLKLCKSYNKYYPKNKIAYSGKNKRELFTALRERMSNQCNSEWCWLDQEFAKDSALLSDGVDKKKIFRPELPVKWRKNKNTWLNSNDIYNVMTQYEEKYPNFQFLGPVSSDCPTEITCELSNMNIKNMLAKGVTQIGIVYNLDTSDGPGTHWVSVYIDLTKCRIFYYDSYGYQPIPRIRKFINQFTALCKREHCPMKFEYNKKRHQYGNSECGVYSMYVITELLGGKTFKQAVSRKIPDKRMNELRFKKFYRVD